MSTISTHVLDTAAGRPAAGVPIVLERVDLTGTTIIGAATTDADGRARDLVAANGAFGVGDFRIRFDVAAYFDACGIADRFYSTIAVEFHVDDAGSHYHVPLLLAPFGYSTYRGT